MKILDQIINLVMYTGRVYDQSEFTGTFAADQHAGLASLVGESNDVFVRPIAHIVSPMALTILISASNSKSGHAFTRAEAKGDIIGKLNGVPVVINPHAGKGIGVVTLGLTGDLNLQTVHTGINPNTVAFV